MLAACISTYVTCPLACIFDGDSDSETLRRQEPVHVADMVEDRSEQTHACNEDVIHVHIYHDAVNALIMGRYVYMHFDLHSTCWLHGYISTKYNTSHARACLICILAAAPTCLS